MIAAHAQVPADNTEPFPGRSLVVPPLRPPGVPDGYCCHERPSQRDTKIPRMLSLSKGTAWALFETYFEWHLLSLKTSSSDRQRGYLRDCEVGNHLISAKKPV